MLRRAFVAFVCAVEFVGASRAAAAALGTRAGEREVRPEELSAWAEELRRRCPVLTRFIPDVAAEDEWRSSAEVHGYLATTTMRTFTYEGGWGMYAGYGFASAIFDLRDCRAIQVGGGGYDESFVHWIGVDAVGVEVRSADERFAQVRAVDDPGALRFDAADARTAAAAAMLGSDSHSEHAYACLDADEPAMVRVGASDAFVTPRMLANARTFEGRAVPASTTYFDGEDLVASYGAIPRPDCGPHVVSLYVTSGGVPPNGCEGSGDGIVIYGRPAPLTLARSGQYELGAQQVRVRQHGAVLSIYDRTERRHRYLGYLDGEPRVPLRTPRYVVIEGYVRHLMMRELASIAIVDLLTATLHRLAWTCSIDEPTDDTASDDADDYDDEYVDDPCTYRPMLRSIRRSRGALVFRTCQGETRTLDESALVAALDHAAARP